jgi:hypothetical protein
MHPMLTVLIYVPWKLLGVSLIIRSFVLVDFLGRVFCLAAGVDSSDCIPDEI